jgi:signal transduction histidine kinase
VRWAALLAVTAASGLPIAALYRVVGAPAPDPIAVGTFTPVAASLPVAPPPGKTSGADVTLPDDWRVTHPDARAGWYRLRFRASGAERLGVYLPSVAMNAAVYVNGERIGDGGRFAADDPSGLARNWNRPLLFHVPPRLVHGGEYALDLFVATDLAGTGFLPAPSVAPYGTLAPVHARASFVRRILLWTIVVFRLVVALFTAAIFVMGRRDAYYGWFALCMVAWVLAELNVLVVNVPLPLPLWYWLFNVAIGWWGILAVRLVLSFIGVSKPDAERRLMVGAVAGSVALGALAASGSRWLHPVAINVWLTFAFGASLYLFRGVLPRLRHYPDAIELNVVFVVALSVLGCVLFDLTLQLGLRPRGGLNVPPYAAFVAVVGMGWVLVRRFVGALAEARSLAETLDARLRTERAAVAASSARILATDRARVLAAERARVLRDTDEGLGAQLVSTLALLERPETATAEIQRSVRAALDDLRLVVDSMDPTEGDLLVMLATLRARLQARCEAAGLRVEWRVRDLPPVPDLTPHRVLQILRVVQGAFAAALAAPPGGTLRVTTYATGLDAVVELGLPAGVAMPAEIDRMRARARDVGGVLDVEAAGGAVVLRLALPLAPAPAAAVSHFRGIAGEDSLR